MRQRGTTTNLDVKLQLWAEGFWAEQAAVAALMKSLASSNGGTWSANGQYRTFSIPASPATSGDTHSGRTPHTAVHSIPSKCRILFLAANPKKTTQLTLDEETRQIDQKLRATEFRDALDLITKWAVQPDDLLQYLNQYRPHIVHFSGHGSPTEEIILLDPNRKRKAVSKLALEHLFTTLKDNIRLVVLNACFSRPQAEAITRVIDCAIGMKRAIGDQAAVKFAASFYRALGFGRSVKEAFEQGKASLMLEGTNEDNTPELLVRQGVDPSTVFLLKVT
jgi:hypothetical protein